MRVPGLSQAIGNLEKWCDKAEWAPLYNGIFDEHLEIAREKFDLTNDEIMDTLGESSVMLYGFVFEDFLSADFGEDGESNVIDDYLSRRGWREKVPARRYLEALRDSAPSVFEVVDLDPGRSMTVRDMVLDGDPVTVEEKSGSESAARWDRVAGRLVTVNGKPSLTGGLLLLPYEVADDVLATIASVAKDLMKELRREAKKQGQALKIADRDAREIMLAAGPICHLITQSWLVDALERARAPLPEMRNSDGESIVMSEVRFPIAGGAAAIAVALDGIGGFERVAPEEPCWGWYEPRQPSETQAEGEGQGILILSQDHLGRTSLGSVEIQGDALVLSTLSQERAARGQALLAAHLADLVGAPLTSHQSVETMLAQRREAAPAPADLPPEVAAQAMHAFMDDHYRSTLDSPLPSLDGKTPRQAARTKKGRAQVVDWLKRLENSEFRRASRQGQAPYDTAWIWKELRIG